MAEYAKNTTVSSEKSRAEIEKTLSRYGADQFFYFAEDKRASIAFRVPLNNPNAEFTNNHRLVRFTVNLPSKMAFVKTPKGKVRTKDQAEKHYEQAVRQRWRALFLVVKAKLEAIESGIGTFEEEFLAYILLPGGQTVKDEVLPKIQLAYESGNAPKLLSQF